MVLLALTVLVRPAFPWLTGSAHAAAPFAVPTFECFGVYWDPADAGTGKVCRVRYRETGAPAWREGFRMVYHDRNATYQGGVYRGSIVHLTPDTEYEIELSLQPAGSSTSFTARTWNEVFPVAQTNELPQSMSSALTISASGTTDGYILYQPAGNRATIDVGGSESYCIEVNGSYVIIRGLTLQNAAIHAIYLGDVHDVVIEDCDISGWGRIDSDGWAHDRDAAIKGREDATNLKRIIVQRNKMHHPRGDSNNWSEERPAHGMDPHPRGPQCIDFTESAGNHVFRYNEAYSDDDHYFNDIFGGGNNRSWKGAPNRDTDIYGNYLSCCWDDAIEAEGANRNVRIWGNYLHKSAKAVAFSSASIGPVYMWRNLSGVCEYVPNAADDGEFPDGPGQFQKSNVGEGYEEFAGGSVYLFNNTILQPEGRGCGYGIRAEGCNMMSRNNILHVRRDGVDESIRDGHDGCDFDYDLYNGTIDVPAGMEASGTNGIPMFDPANGKGEFYLSPASAGCDAGTVITNFVETYTGDAPDMGAHERGTPPMRFGVPGDAAGFHAGNWTYRMKITFDGYDRGETLTDFPALVVFNEGLTNFHYSQFASSRGRDLRFADAAETNELYYEIEDWNTGGDSYVWVRVPRLTAHGHIWAYWGNADQTNPPAYTTNGATWSENYRVVWHLAETNGTTANDSTANNNDGTLHNMESGDWQAGPFANGLSFDGVDEYVDTGVLSDSLPGDLSASLWFNAEDSSGERLLDVAQANYEGLQIRTFTGGLIQFDDEGGPANRVGTTGDVLDGVWRHVLVTRSGTTYELYVDGVSYGTSGGTAPEYAKLLMAVRERLNQYWLGIGDEVRVCDCVRSSNWVWAVWMNGASNDVFNTYGTVVGRGLLVVIR